MTDPYLRGSSTISDLEFVQAVATLRRPTNGSRPAYYWVMIWDIAEFLHIHPNRIRSKMRRMMKRKLIDGCNCGCRGDIELLSAGEKLLLKGEQ